jgi:hypothetical protein
MLVVAVDGFDLGQANPHAIQSMLVCQHSTVLLTLLLAFACCAGCSVHIKRIRGNGATRLSLTLAEVSLLVTADDTTISNSMSSGLGTGTTINACIDGDVSTYCASAESDAYFRVDYQCQAALTAVRVVNAVGPTQDHILQYRMRVLAADGVTDLFNPFDFRPTQAFYYWDISGPTTSE